MRSTDSLPFRFTFTLWAVVLGFLISGMGTVPWGILVAVNLKTSPRFPWAVAAMAAWLWVFWQYLGGRWPPKRTSESRRLSLRANPVPMLAWRWLLLAGGLSLVSMVGLWLLVARMTHLPGKPLPDVSSYPLYTIIAMTLMGSLVAPFCEKAGFRGYMQGRLERMLGPAAGIGVSSIVFALAHYTHGITPALLFLYFAGGVMFGVPAYLTDSLWPGIVVHIGTDLTFFWLVWPADAVPRPLVWQTGADLWFWTYAAAFAVGLIAASCFYRKVARDFPSLRARQPV